MPEAFTYDWAEVTEEVGGHRYTLRALVDFERTVTRLCTHVLEDGGTARWFEELCPMFGVVWPSARALAEVVAAEPVAGRRVLELGCGLGLPSLVAARAGAEVLATDQHPHAGALFDENAARNGLLCRFASFDWRGATPPGVHDRSFDHVLASDVLYARDQPDLVAGAFARFLARRGTGWLADPGRPWLQEFADAAGARGLAAQVGTVGEVFVITVTWV